MPAVDLERLKSELNDLTWKFTQPVDFLSLLHEIFEHYADRLYRLGMVMQAPKRIKSFRVPRLVIQQIEQLLAPLCRENPAASLNLADALWREEMLETRLLATSILGFTPLKASDEIVARIKAWAQPDEEMDIIHAVFFQAGSQVQRKMPEVWLDLVRSWLGQKTMDWQRLGLTGLLPLIENNEYDNFPPIFDLISPLLALPPEDLQSDLLYLLEALAHRIPLETIALLTYIINMGAGPASIRLFRRALPAFEPEQQAHLRKLLRMPNV